MAQKYKIKLYKLVGKGSNTLGKILDVGNKLLPLAEMVVTALGYGPEELGFEISRKGLDMVNNAKHLLIHYVIKEEHLRLVVYHLHK